VYVSFSIFGKEVFCLDIQQNVESLDFDDFVEEEEGEEEEGDEEVEEEEVQYEEVCWGEQVFRWGEPHEFQRNIFVP
jgi:hypothetical protein